MKLRQILLDVAPTIFLFAIPALLVWLTGSDIGGSFPQPLNWLLILLGILPCLAGLGLMVWTIQLFWVKGKGTLAPLDPTKKLVVVGPYRHVRNPMYSGLLLVLYGEAILFGSIAILVFATLILLAVLSYVHLKEEHDLEKRFGKEYQSYKAHVPRWVPQLKPWEGEET